MRDIDSNAQVSKVEPVAQPNERQRDDMMSDKLLEILPRLLQLQHQHDRLLCPVTRLEQVKGLEERFMLPVGKTFEHGRRVEIPNVRPVHHIKTKRSEDTKVDRGVHLLHETCSLAFTADSAPNCQRTDHTLHQELASERQNNRVEGHKSNILRTFSVHDGATGRLRRLRIGQKDGAVHGVGLCWVDQVQRQEDNQDEKREEPCVLQTDILRATEQRSILAAFRLRLGLLGRSTRLRNLLVMILSTEVMAV